MTILNKFENFYNKLFTLKADIFCIFLLFLVSLIPLLWYKPGTLGMGHDMGWSLVPIERFIDRSFAWTRAGFGYDQSASVGAITFYGIEALFSYSGLSIILVQKITFIFWFFALSISMYYLSRVLYAGRYSKPIALIAAIFYTLNNFTLHSFVVAEFSKFSAMVLFPFFLALLWQVIDKRIALLKGSILIGLISLIFNGGGATGLPLWGGIIISVALLFLYKLIIEKKSIFGLIKIYLAFFIAIILVNLYWIIPLFHVISSQYSPFTQSGGLESAVSWTNLISKNTSFINLFMLQGDPGWYDTPNHPYASIFLNNPLFVFLSVIFALISFLAIFLVKNNIEKNIIIFLSLLALLAMVFAAGTHYPTGFIYEILMKNVFGFAIFRSAFFKFGYVLWFSYAFLIAFTSIRLIDKIFNKKRIVLLVTPLVIGLIFFYNFPFFSDKAFVFNLPFKTMINLPSYITKSIDYVNSLPYDSRIMLIPPPSPKNGQTDIYNFGYFSRDPLPFYITQKSVITNLEINSGVQEKLTEEFYKAVLSGDENAAKKIVDILGVTNLLVRNDVMVDNSSYRIINPEKFIQKMLLFSWVKKDQSFGNWDFYKVNSPAGQISAMPLNFYFYSAAKGVQDFVNLNNIDIGKTIILSTNYLDELKGNISGEISAFCQTCDTLGKEELPAIDNVKLLPTSFLYSIVQAKEKKILTSLSNDDYLYLRFLLVYSKKRALELSALAANDINKFLKKDAVAKVSLDQKKRSDLFNAYKSLLDEIPERYSRISDVERIRLAPIMIQFFEDQRSLIMELRGPFLDDISDEYFRVLDSLNALLGNADLRENFNYQNNFNVFTFNVDYNSNYSINFQDLSKGLVLLDGKKLEKQKGIYLEKGSHRIDLEKQSVVPSFFLKEVILNRNHLTIQAPLASISKSKKYSVSFECHNDQNDGQLVIEIIDELGKRIISQISDCTTSGNLISDSFYSRSEVNGAYALRFSSSGKSYTHGDIKIQNIMIAENNVPKLAIYSRGQVKGNFKIPLINVIYKNPTKYLIYVKDAKGPFILFFKQTYSPDWQAKIDDMILAKHFPADLSFNGWYVEKKGNYLIEINFDTQKKYEIGKIISTVVLAAMLLTLFLISFIKKRS